MFKHICLFRSSKVKRAFTPTQDEEQSQHTTINIRHRAESAIFNRNTFNEKCNDSKGSCSKVPYDLIFEPLAASKRVNTYTANWISK